MKSLMTLAAVLCAAGVTVAQEERKPDDLRRRMEEMERRHREEREKLEREMRERAPRPEGERRPEGGRRPEARPQEQGVEDTLRRLTERVERLAREVEGLRQGRNEFRNPPGRGPEFQAPAPRFERPE